MPDSASFACPPNTQPIAAAAAAGGVVTGGHPTSSAAFLCSLHPQVAAGDSFSLLCYGTLLSSTLLVLNTTAAAAAAATFTRCQSHYPTSPPVLLLIPQTNGPEAQSRG